MSPATTATAALQTTPLCVDLDGTLVKSDTLVDSIFALIRQRPLDGFWLPGWLFQGKAGFKAEVGRRVQLFAETLPYNQPLLEYLRVEHAAGRKSTWRLLVTRASQARLLNILGSSAG